MLRWWPRVGAAELAGGVVIEVARRVAKQRTERAWMNRVRRCASGVIVLLAVLTASDEPAEAFCIWGFGQCETSNPIAGEYILDGNPSAMLTITRDKITSKTGPVSFTVDYVVKSVEGKNVTIVVSPPEPKETLQVQVEKDLIKFRKNSLFAGDWKKKAANPQ